MLVAHNARTDLQEEQQNDEQNHSSMFAIGRGGLAHFVLLCCDDFCMRCSPQRSAAPGGATERLSGQGGKETGFRFRFPDPKLVGFRHSADHFSGRLAVSGPLHAITRQVFEC